MERLPLLLRSLNPPHSQSCQEPETLFLLSSRSAPQEHEHASLLFASTFPSFLWFQIFIAQYLGCPSILRGDSAYYQEAKSDCANCTCLPLRPPIPVASEGLAPPAPTRIQPEAEYSQGPEPGRQEHASKA